MIGIIVLCAIIFVEGILALYALLRRGYDSSNKHTNHYKHIRDQATKVEPEETRPKPEPKYTSASSDGISNIASFVSAIVTTSIVLMIGMIVLQKVQTAMDVNSTAVNNTPTEMISVLDGIGSWIGLIAIIISASMIISIFFTAGSVNDESTKPKKHRNKPTTHYRYIRDQATKVEKHDIYREE